MDGDGVSLHSIVVSSEDSIPLSMGSSGHERFKWRFANEMKAATATFLKLNDNQDMNQEIQRSTPSVFDDENLIELSEQAQQQQGPVNSPNLSIICDGGCMSRELSDR